MKLKTMLMSAAALGVIAAGPALANDPASMSGSASGSTSGTVAFSSLDANGNGTVSQSEFTDAGLDGATFAQLDINSDGALTRSEVRASSSAGTSSHMGDKSTSSSTMTGSGTVNN